MPLYSKSARILELYGQFQMGKVVNKQQVAEQYGVSVRSVQRDIDTIRDFLSEQVVQNGVRQSIEYDTSAKGYRLVTQEMSHLSEGEMLAVCKILLESRAFSKSEMASLLGRILSLSVSPKDREQIEGYIANELFNYIDPAHPSVNSSFLWQIAQAIKEQHILEISYSRLKGKETVIRKIEPVGILFSEFYFYLMGIIDDPEKRKNFDKEDDPFPTIYRIDRIQNIRDTNEKFVVPYKDRFKEGEYKNKVQYMWGGEPQQVEFKYYGSSIEAVLDRLPMAEVVEEKEGVYAVKAETFGKGILMWLLSQGSKIEIVSPHNLKMAWLNEAVDILTREGKIYDYGLQTG